VNGPFTRNYNAKLNSPNCAIYEAKLNSVCYQSIKAEKTKIHVVDTFCVSDIQIPPTFSHDILFFLTLGAYN